MDACFIIIVILVAVIVVLSIMLYNAKHKNPGAEADSSLSSAIRPLDGKGSPVDWFVVFKLPNKTKNCSNSQGTCLDVCDCSGCSTEPAKCTQWNTGSSAGDRSSGECYYYADSNNSSLTFYTDLGFGCLSSDNNPLSRTLAQIKSAGSQWALWNDQGVSKNCSSPHAHSKGAVCYNSNGGFVMNTSSPHWPNSDLEPMGCQKVSNVEYAQHVFCFSISSAGAKQWQAGANSASLCITESSFMNTGPLSGGETPSPITLTTLGGMEITALFKGSQESYQPWSLVSESIGVDLKVASWTSNASGTTSGWGTKYEKYKNGSRSLSQVLDVNTDHGCFKTLYSFSHSKWAISTEGDWVIFGSMNMQDSQAPRGGDFYAFHNKALWTSLNSFITNEVERD